MLRRLVRDPVLWTLVLLGLAVLCWAYAVRAGEYRREDWLPHWADEDHNCRDTRQEVLARDAVPGTIRWDDAGCTVIAGWWRDPYSGQKVTDPTHLDVDHVAPLAWVHAHGGADWSIEKKRAYANDLSYRGTLLATTAKMNRSKGSKGPAEWIPPQDGYFACEYGTYWAVVTTLWELRLEDSERAALRLLLRFCR